MNEYIPERDDYLSWKDDIDKIPEWDDGTHTELIENVKIWKINGVIHREDDKPAKIFVPNDVWSSKELHWVRNGQFYRDDDKPSFINSLGERIWHHRDNYHKPISVSIGYDGIEKSWKYPNGDIIPPNWVFGECVRHNEKYLNMLMRPYVGFGRWNVIKQYELQKILIEINPSLVCKIQPLHPKIKKEYRELLELGNLGL